MTIYFFSKGEEQYRFLSNFYQTHITCEGKVWTSVEHYYQAMKYDSELMQEQVRHLTTAAETKRFAKEHRHLVRPDWEHVKVDYMRVIVHLKFSQSKGLRNKLLATGIELLVEDSPWDSFWGSGRDGKGLNMLGKILMETRAQLRELATLE